PTVERCRAGTLYSNNQPPPVIYPLSLHDALPICCRRDRHLPPAVRPDRRGGVPGLTVASPFSEGKRRIACFSMSRTGMDALAKRDRKSTRLNSSHRTISYAVFCLKKKMKHPRKTF